MTCKIATLSGALAAAFPSSPPALNAVTCLPCMHYRSLSTFGQAIFKVGIMASAFHIRVPGRARGTCIFLETEQLDH